MSLTVQTSTVFEKIALENHGGQFPPLPETAPLESGSDDMSRNPQGHAFGMWPALRLPLATIRIDAAMATAASVESLIGGNFSDLKRA